MGKFLSMALNDLGSIAKALPAVAEHAYEDALAPAFREFGRFGEDLVKTVRLVLFPVQFAAAYQDRFASYIRRAIAQVPEPRRVTPRDSLILPIAERLKYQEADSPITDIYINLLSRAMDGARIGEAHPAFIGIISQLAPDEASFITLLADFEYSLIFKQSPAWETPSAAEADAILQAFGFPEALDVHAREILFPYQKLNQPQLFYIFLEHLYHLGLVEYSNEPINDGPFKGYHRPSSSGVRCVFIHLSHLGRLFSKPAYRNEATAIEQRIS